MNNHLVLMARAPRIGTVKSRLAAGVGLVRAWAFYRRTLFATARNLHDARWISRLCVTPDLSVHTVRLWPRGWQTIPQHGGDLGTRMLRPMQTLPPGPVVVIGADIPAIRPRHIAAAFTALGENDFVFGPATDGGYWLVGARRRPRLCNPFQGVRWSSAHALADTVANLPHGAKIKFLETLSDVDDVAALKAVL